MIQLIFVQLQLSKYDIDNQLNNYIVRSKIVVIVVNNTATRTTNKADSIVMY